jgi:outer membrane immunogenic protein
MFIGAFAGGAWGALTDDDGDIFTTDGITFDDSFDVSGWVFGLDAGANWTVGNGIVLGIVGDIGWADLNGDDTFGFFDGEGGLVDTGAFSASLDWAGSVRGRLGWDGGAWMPYLTAGVAFAHVSGDLTTTGGDLVEFDDTRVGWTAGLGVEFAVAQDLSIDLLWRWTDYGDLDFGDFTVADVPFAGDNINVGASTLTAGLHWRF